MRNCAILCRWVLDHDAAATALAANAALTRLERLDLRGTAIGATGFDARAAHFQLRYVLVSTRAADARARFPDGVVVVAD